MSDDRTRRELERELRRSRRIVEASHALHATLDLDELLRLILEEAKEGVEAERGTVFLLSEDGKELWSRVLVGDRDLEIRLPLGQGIAGAVASTGEAVRLADARQDPRFDASWDRKSGFVTRQLLTAPIRNRDGKVLGVFQLLNKRRGDFDEEDEIFLQDLSVHAALAVENAQLYRAAVEKERQDREIGVVRTVQRAYQPERMTAELGTLRVAGLNVLCEDASGDYYDVIELPDGRVAVVVGDVSGHGLGAALVMAQARALLRAFCTTLGRLAPVLGRINDALARDLTGGRFMSMFVAVAEPESGRLRWSSAGHPPALLRRAATGAVERLLPRGRILGAFPAADYEPAPDLALEAGDVLLLYTDGVTEAQSSAERALGEEGLVEILHAIAEREPADILSGIREAVVAFTGRETFRDDLTLVALKRVGALASPPQGAS